MSYKQILTTNDIGTGANQVAAGNHTQAYTSSECTTYTSDDNKMGVTPAAVKKAFTIFEPKSHNHDSSYIINGGGDGGSISSFINSAKENQNYYWGFNGGSNHTYAIPNNNMYVGNATKAQILQHYSGSIPLQTSQSLEYISGGFSIGTNPGQCQPNSGVLNGVWYYPPEGTYSDGNSANLQVLRLTWDPLVWVNELFFSPNSNRFFHRNIQNGTALPWRQIWEAGDSVTGAVWNDYAEYRESVDTKDFGYVLIENGDDTLSKSTKRLQPFAGVSSDTWGFSQGKTEKAKTPIAVAGRVLVYPYQDRNNYKPGDCVCTAPGGKVDIMTREEIKEYPDRIVGTVSCIPTYEEWGGGPLADRGPIKVNGRIWIKVL